MPIKLQVEIHCKQYHQQNCNGYKKNIFGYCQWGLPDRPCSNTKITKPVVDKWYEETFKEIK